MAGRLVRCAETNTCDALSERLGKRGAKGFIRIDYTCMRSGDYRGTLVAYCKTKDDPGLTVNFCPFCGFDFFNVYRKGKRLSLEKKPEIKKRKLKPVKD